MSEWRSSTTGIRWWSSRSSIRSGRSGSWWKTTATHVHWRRPWLTTASWPWSIGISARRRAALTVAVVVLSSIALIVAAAAAATTTTIFVIAIIALVLIVLLWLVVLLGARSTRILSLWRRSWVCHR